LCHAVNNLP